MTVGEQGDQPNELMTVKEVAGMLRVERRTVFRWIARGRLRVLRMGGVVRFRRTEVLRAMEMYENGPPPKRDDAMW